MISMVDISVSFTKVMLDLAGLYLMTEDLDSCQHQLMSLLKNEKENDAATIVSRDRAEIGVQILEFKRIFGDIYR